MLEGWKCVPGVTIPSSFISDVHCLIQTINGQVVIITSKMIRWRGLRSNGAHWAKDEKEK